MIFDGCGRGLCGLQGTPGRRKAVFLRHSPSRSRPLEQAKKQTDGPQTRANTRLRALNAQEGSREQREKSGGMRAWNGDFRRACSRGKGPKPRQHRGNGQKKSQPDKGWDFTLWWSRRESNPRPKDFQNQFYVCSDVFSVLVTNYADAQAQSVTSHLFFSSIPSSPAWHDPIRMTLLSLAGTGLSANRCSGLGLKRPERNARRWRL